MREKSGVNMNCYLCKHYFAYGDTYYDCEFQYECIKLGGVFEPKQEESMCDLDDCPTCNSRLTCTGGKGY